MKNTIKINYKKIKIKDTKVGDVVRSYNVLDKEYRFNSILNKFEIDIKHEKQVVYTLENGEEIVSSDYHKFYVLKGCEWGYFSFLDGIDEKCYFLDTNHQIVKIKSVHLGSNKDTDFHDIHVSRDNNFICGKTGVVSHNSMTIFFPFFNYEIRDLLVLKNNRGTDDNRVRKIDYTIQFNKLFYKRFLANEDITLFSTSDVPDLYEAFFESNEKFEELYTKYEKDPSIRKTVVSSSEIFGQYCKERFETGRIYSMNVDHANDHSPFTESVYMSNLCQEILLVSDPINDVKSDEGEVALCVLSAINLGNIRKLEDLEDICKEIVKNLDWIIENQYYPFKTAEKMKNRRSIGVGVTNFAYYLAKNGYSYEDSEALQCVNELFESIQYYLLKASNEFAKEHGACKWFDKTKYAQGILPIDTYCKNVDNIITSDLKHDWETLRADIKEFGLRNSTLTAQMPVESSSVVTNSTNGIEPIINLITIKTSKQSRLPIAVPEISKLKNKYTMAYDMRDNTGYINICAVMQKYIDQSISANHYYNPKNYPDGNVPMSVVMKDNLYSYKMGLKTLYYANTDDGKSDNHVKDEDQDCPGGACKL